MWDVKEPTHYSKRVGQEVPGAVGVTQQHKYSFLLLPYDSYAPVAQLDEHRAVTREGMGDVGEVRYGLTAAAWSAFTCWRHKVWNNDVRWTRLLSTHSVETWELHVQLLKIVKEEAQRKGELQNPQQTDQTKEHK